MEHDEHYIVTFPNGYGRLVCLTADLCNGSTDYCSVMVRRCVEGRERDERWGGGRTQRMGWREREDRGRQTENKEGGFEGFNCQFFYIYVYI